MKVCFYSPYIPKHFGGGEKHLFDIASLVATKHDVSIALPSSEKKTTKQLDKIKKDYESFLNYSFKNITFIESPLAKGSVVTKLNWTKQFDYLYYATDGSLFSSLAKKNNLHIQVPFTVKKKSPIDRIKLRNWNIKNTNSVYTKKVIEKSWKTKIDYVHYPKVDLSEIKPGKNKEKVILNVGRFFKQLHSKRQDVLVDVFVELVKKHPKLMSGWKLILVGSVEDRKYYEEIKKAASGYPIEFYERRKRKDLIQLFRNASIYWHATGFEVDEETSPEKAEHFGITTIEAMAAGAIPIVVGKGGQVEIIGNDLSELLWQTKDQCLEKTLKVIDNTISVEEIRKKMISRVEKFNSKVFEETVWKMFE